jgi:hypothetical protein
MQIEDTPISLAECHRRLVAEMGDQAPAEITLRRMKKDGRLKRAIAKGTGHRTARYYFLEVYKIAQGISLANRPAPLAPSRRARRAEVGELSAAALAHISQMFAQQMSHALKAAAGSAGQGAQSADGAREIKAAVDNLEATRKMLMLRYDAELTSLKARNAQLEADLRLAQSTSLDASRLTQRLGAVISLLERQAG